MSKKASRESVRVTAPDTFNEWIPETKDRLKGVGKQSIKPCTSRSVYSLACL